MGVPNLRLKWPKRSGAARSSAAMAYVRLTAMNTVTPEANSDIAKPSATSHPRAVESGVGRTPSIV